LVFKIERKTGKLLLTSFSYYSTWQRRGNGKEAEIREDSVAASLLQKQRFGFQSLRA
jgi:hypothetical protein